jgi:hypothetical protein
LEQVKEAIDSMVGYPRMTGIMGGEPLIHPQFKEICEYARSKIAPELLGLWTCLPEGYEHYREDIVATFKHIFLNDHTKGDVYHTPVLVAAKEMCVSENQMWYSKHHCWVQNSWSASINPNGAFFCEVAAALSILFNMKAGWKVEPKWWLRTPKDYVEQMKLFCPSCGCDMPLKKRLSTDEVDDISQSNYERLKDVSPKLKEGKYVISDLKPVEDDKKMATYKDEAYRSRVAERYGMFLMVNNMGFQTPFLKRNWTKQEVV